MNMYNLASTSGLNTALENVDNIHDFIINYEAAFDDKNFYSLLNSLITKSGKSKGRVAIDSWISEPYMYNLIKGEKRPTRDTVIKLSFGLQLPLEVTERLLKLAGYDVFYVRRKRDAILKFGVHNSLSITEVEELLMQYGLSLITE
jgi:hypothetical protein